MQHDNDNTHMKGTPQLSLQSFFIHNDDQIQSYNGNPFSPTLTSLEEGASSRIYTKHRPSSPGGGTNLKDIDQIC